MSAISATAAGHHAVTAVTVTTRAPAVLLPVLVTAGMYATALH